MKRPSPYRLHRQQQVATPLPEQTPRLGPGFPGPLIRSRPFTVRGRGFNLLEVVIAAFLFSVISVACLGVWGLQVRSVEKARHMLVGSLLAEQVMEVARSEGYERVPLTEEDGPEEQEIELVHESRRSTGGGETWSEVPVVYKTSLEAYTWGDPDEDRLKRVVVRVTWDDTTKTGEIVLESFLAGAL